MEERSNKRVEIQRREDTVNRTNREIKWRDSKRKKVVGRIACDSISLRVSCSSGHMDHVVPLPFLTAGVSPVSGGDVNRDWEGCGKGEVVS